MNIVIDFFKQLFSTEKEVRLTEEVKRVMRYQEAITAIENVIREKGIELETTRTPFGDVQVLDCVSDYPNFVKLIQLLEATRIHSAGMYYLLDLKYLPQFDKWSFSIRVLTYSDKEVEFTTDLEELSLLYSVYSEMLGTILKEGGEELATNGTTNALDKRHERVYGDCRFETYITANDVLSCIWDLSQGVNGRLVEKDITCRFHDKKSNTHTVLPYLNNAVLEKANYLRERAVAIQNQRLTNFINSNLKKEI